MTSNAFLNEDRIINTCPAVLGESKHKRLNDSYEIVPTINVIRALKDEGWMPTQAVQVNSALPERIGTNRHLVRFRHVESTPIVGDSHPEILIMNSHNGATSFYMNAGLYRMICSNGLVVDDATFETRKYRHSTGVTGEIIEGVYEVIDSIAGIEDKIKKYNGLMLNQAKRTELARRVMTVVRDKNYAANVDLEQLVLPNRTEDSRPSLWQTYNTLQERVINGSQVQRLDTTRPGRFRGITAPRKNVEINKAIWSTMSEFYDELKAG